MDCEKISINNKNDKSETDFVKTLNSNVTRRPTRTRKIPEK